ncbi:MlaC/ttg2D family ABC transporter substrate-binding protein [Commensalibacter communis]|uniref:MlaC/ttg2D family ABC transporter substrate-binding protein n=1 Tax=Commensalibacter communis TaxID=2972786 RepID=UPI0022FF8F23|nr:ABC transporter substrate-binding protein [Commensalibacter communis]CAI3945189.1 Periplasmic subunit MlaC of the ABC-type intermembrane phospholipid transporter Mla (MlaC) (PDB:2QGU) (PUBMED:19383799) [Commensalibacter communis]CAI3945381.1 Periplasmic subunit MlaC of the ABC-type intermembrane phospholipid transporter Mla (MlaC) (PDB:2QGU) (PUBMED:19383799) [Commensalibacter communis]
MKIYSCRFLFSIATVSSILLSSNIVPYSPLAIPGAHAQKSYSGTELRQWLEATGNKMVSVVNSNKSAKEKKEQFLTILNQDVDVDTIAKFCLGRFWRIATPEQQKEYVQLFHQVLINSITDRLGEYKGVSFDIGKVSTVEGGRFSIETILHRPKQPNVSIQWVISTESGSPRVVDIIGENASLSVTQRGDYTSFIARHGNNVSALIDALKRQISKHP